MALQLCPSCARHVRDSETRCPFCDANVSFESVARAAPPRLSRAAQMAFVASVMLGCRDETRPPNDPTTTGEDASVPPVTTIAPPAETTTAAPADAGPPIDYAPPANLKKPYGAPPADGLLT